MHPVSSVVWAIGFPAIPSSDSLLRKPELAGLNKGMAEAREKRVTRKRSTRPPKDETGRALSESVSSLPRPLNIRRSGDGTQAARSILPAPQVSARGFASPPVDSTNVPVRYVRGDLQCPLCPAWAGVSTASALERHFSAAHKGQVPFYLCLRCPFRQRSVQSVAAHMRHCEGPSAEGTVVNRRQARVASGEFGCEYCTRSFGSVQGRGQHVRIAHPAEYHEALVAPTERGAGWSACELKTMAKIEAIQKLAGASRTVVKELRDAVPHRSIQAVYAIRKKPEYRALLESEVVRLHAQAAGGGESADSQSSDSRVSGESSSSPAQSPHVESAGTAEDPGSLVRRALCEFLATERRPREGGLTQQIRTFVSGALEGSHAPLFTELWDFWRTNAPKPNGTRNAPHKRRRPVPTPRRRRRVRRREWEYKVTQEALRRCRKTTVDQMLDGTFVPSEEERLPDPLEVNSVFREKLERATPPTADRRVPKPTEHHNISNQPLTPQEVQSALQGMKASSAPGPDGWMTKSSLQKVPVEGLTAVLNVFLWKRWLPEQLTESRSILVPKHSGASDQVSEYRPISITSALSRLYARVVSRRLQGEVPFHIRQKAFIDEDGCFANIHALRTVLKEARRRRSPVAACLLDLSKAFDSVPHWSVEDGLRRKGFDDDSVSVVRSFYNGAITRFQVSTDGSSDQQIKILSGVRQGCPLSPYLFNSVIDDALSEINGDDTLGVHLGSSRLTCMAFADDLVLFGNSKFQLQSTIDRAYDILTSAGLSFNASKSMTIRLTPVRGKKVLKVVSTPEFHVGGVAIPCVKVADHVRYLGLDITPQGTSSRGLVAKLTRWLGNLQKYRLKPETRVEIVRQSILGKMAYTLRNCDVNRQVLEKMDRAIRGYAKRVLHLPPGTPSSWFYLNLSKGGLGLRQLRTSIPAERARALEGLADLDDGVMQEVRNASQKELEGLLRMIPGGTTGDRQAQRVVEFTGTEWGKYAGAMVRSEASFAPLLGAGSEVGGHRLVRAAQVLSGNLPTRSALHRGHTLTDQRSTICRRCNAWHETEPHVLSGCAQMKDAYVRRHDRLVETLVKGLESGARQVFPEMEYQLRGERFRPDLTCVAEDRVDVVEVSVPFASSLSYLEERARDKEEKYLRPCFLEAVSRRFPGRTVTVRSVVVGCRGEIPPKTRCSLTDLGIWHLRKRLQCSALFGSLWVFDTFRSHGNYCG